MQQHHAKAAPRWLRINEVMLSVTNLHASGLQPQRVTEPSHFDLGIAKPHPVISPLSSFCRAHRTAKPGDDLCADISHRPQRCETVGFVAACMKAADKQCIARCCLYKCCRWPWFGDCCEQPVLIQRYCRYAVGIVLPAQPASLPLNITLRHGCHIRCAVDARCATSTRILSFCIVAVDAGAMQTLTICQQACQHQKLQRRQQSQRYTSAPTAHRMAVEKTASRGPKR